jgi:uracil-DNA glycosylase
MRWTERQVAMLHEMGVRIFQPPAPLSPVASLVAVAVLPSPNRVAPHQGTALSSRSPPRAGAAMAATIVPHAALDAVANMGWQDLRTTVAQCTACALCQGRRQTVFGVGHEQAHWMIVGEAPGEQEDQQGEPFVGKSGQLLDNMLRAVGLSRGPGPAEQQVYIANTLKCRPPGNRNPGADELAACEAFLIRQVQLVQPKIILAMGRFAVQSLLRSAEPIGRLRGRVHHYQNAPLVVTYHPAYLLRNPQDKAKAWDDLCLAVQTLQPNP